MRPHLADLPSDADAPPHSGVAWDDAPCPLCGDRDEEPRFEATDPSPAPDQPALRFLVVRCRRCDLLYTNPRPDAGGIAHFYPPTYRPHHRPRKPAADGRPHPLERLLASRPPARFLDFGCGGGRLLQRMAARGWEVTGVDASPAAVQAVRGFGLPAVLGTLPHPDLRPAGFDVIAMWHSLEHAHDPLDVLRAAYHLLAPGGTLLVACPNIHSWAFRRYADCWYGLDLPRHLTHFTPASLRLMLQTAGLRVSKVAGLRHADWVRQSAARAAAGPDADWLDRVLRWKPAAKLAAWVADVLGQTDSMLAVAERPG